MFNKKYLDVKIKSRERPEDRLPASNRKQIMTYREQATSDWRMTASGG